MNFQVAIILKCTFSYIGIKHIFLFIFAVNHVPFHMSTILFLWHCVPLFEVSEGTECLSAFVSFYMYLSASVILTINLH